MGLALTCREHIHGGTVPSTQLNGRRHITTHQLATTDADDGVMFGTTCAFSHHRPTASVSVGF